MSRFASFIAALALIAGFSATARADEQFVFGGTPGTSLTIAPVNTITYTVTDAASQFYFVIKGTGSPFSGPTSSGFFGPILFSTDGFTTNTVDSLYAGVTIGSLAPSDIAFYRFGANPVAPGDTVTLFASGTNFTSASMAAGPPASGAYQTYLVSNLGNIISTNGVPEPTSLSLIALGSVALVRRRR